MKPVNLLGPGGAVVQAFVWKTYEPSRIRRGRASTCPTWHVRIIGSFHELTKPTRRAALEAMQRRLHGAKE